MLLGLYIALAIITMGFQTYYRYPGCAEATGCGLSFTKSVVWSAIWPAYWAIGATASAHGLIILTPNTRHFEPLGLATINPFQVLPSDN